MVPGAPPATLAIARSSQPAGGSTSGSARIYWRGFVQSRLQRFGAAWALVGTSLVFGLSHLAAQLASSHGDAPGAAASCIVNQAMLGVAFGIMFQRTGSVIAPSVFHVLFNLSLDLGRLLARGA